MRQLLQLQLGMLYINPYFYNIHVPESVIHADKGCKYCFLEYIHGLIFHLQPDLFGMYNPPFSILKDTSDLHKEAQQIELNIVPICTRFT